MTLGGRAVVLGAGVAGVCAAAALRGAVDEVVIIERDRLEDSSSSRRGVPQSAQLHNLLGAAQVGIEALLPGFVDALLAQGAALGRVSSDTHVHELGVRMPERDLGLRILSANRLSIEAVARRLLLDLGGVTLRDGVTATGLKLDGGSVRGVETEGSSIEADVIVDATGAGTPIPRWLGELGVDVPTVTEPISRWYATAVLSTSRPIDRNRFFMVFPTPPATRGGLASPIDDRHLQVSLNGGPGDDPPRSPEAFRGYAGSLEDGVLGELISLGELVVGPTVFRVPSAVWRRYDQCLPRVAGLLPIGDALATLNPLFGQGMSVAAMEAQALSTLLPDRDPQRDGDLPTATQRYLADAVAAVRRAWDLGTLVDPADAWREVFSDRGAATRFADRLAIDPEAHRTYVSIWHLLEPLSALDPSAL